MEREIALKPQADFKSLILPVLLGNILLILSAKIMIPLPFTPVPITMQSLVCVLLGVYLGPLKGLCAFSFYLVEGLVGLPVFAGGVAGALILKGPTFGYLIGMLLAVPVCGLIKQKVSPISLILVGHMLIFFFGVSWLANLQGSYAVAFSLGLFPFVPGLILKILLGSLILKKIR